MKKRKQNILLRKIYCNILNLPIQATSVSIIMSGFLWLDKFQNMYLNIEYQTKEAKEE